MHKHKQAVELLTRSVVCQKKSAFFCSTLGSQPSLECLQYSYVLKVFAYFESFKITTLSNSSDKRIHTLNSCIPVPSSRFSGDPPPASIAGHCGAAWTSCCQAALALTGHGTRSNGTGHNEMEQAIMICT